MATGPTRFADVNSLLLLLLRLPTVARRMLVAVRFEGHHPAARGGSGPQQRGLLCDDLRSDGDRLEQRSGSQQEFQVE